MTARDDYARELIDQAELEQRIETQLLTEADRDHSVPDGWTPLPPCDHEWIEITAFGRTREYMCRDCGLSYP